MRVTQYVPAPGTFFAVIKGGKHDGHVHAFGLVEGRPPRLIKVSDGVLVLQRVTDAVGRHIYAHSRGES